MPDVLNNNNEHQWPSTSYLVLAATLTFGQRFVIPIGRYEVGVSLVVCSLVLAYWVFRGEMYVHSTRFVLYLLAVSGIVVCAVCNFDDPEMSLVKVAYLIVIYGSWMFVHHDVRGPIPFFRCFRFCMTVIACIGLAQFLIQIVGIRLIDPYSLLPERFIAKGFYSHQPIAWGAEFYKSYGVVLFEPSYYSRMLAIALVIEVLIFKQIWRMILFGVAIIPAFSGTGLIILVALYPRLAFDRPKLVGGLTLAATLLLIPVMLFTSTGRTFLGRSTEFSSDVSSGRLRFVAPYVRLVETFDAHYFIGHGPGTIEQFENVRKVALKRDRHVVYSFGYSYVKLVDAYPNTLVTLIYELGVLPGLPLLAYIVYCFFRRVWSYPVSVALFMYLMLLAGDLTQVETVMLCYSLSFMSIRPLAIASTAVREFASQHRVLQPLTARSPSVALR
jgi:hypothetical protein